MTARTGLDLVEEEQRPAGDDALPDIKLEPAQDDLRVEVVAEVDVQVAALLEIELGQRLEFRRGEVLDEPGLADLPGPAHDQRLAPRRRFPFH